MMANEAAWMVIAFAATGVALLHWWEARELSKICASLADTQRTRDLMMDQMHDKIREMEATLNDAVVR